MTDNSVRPTPLVIALFFIQKRERPAGLRPFLFFACRRTKFHRHTSRSGRASPAATARIFIWTEHNRAAALRASSCRRGIIRRQASVRQAKFVSAALRRSRDFPPTSRILSFLCTYFSAATSSRRYFGRIRTPPGTESLGVHPWIFGELGISEPIFAPEHGVR